METSKHSLASFVGDLKQTLYLTHHCTKVSLNSTGTAVLIVPTEKAAEITVSLDKIRRLVIIGRVGKVDSEVLYRLMIRHIPVDFQDVFGYPVGQLEATNKDENYFISAQENFFHSSKALELSKRIVLAKIGNERELIRRRADLPVGTWKMLENNVRYSNDFDKLRGAEGFASRQYFLLWDELITPYGFSWGGRMKHPSPDPVNFLLSFGYTQLRNRLSSALKANGLNPRLGFFHAIRGSHCALASDLMEQFRAFVDTTVLKMIRQNRVKPNDFCQNGEGKFQPRDNSVFSVVLHSFEDMFSNIYKIYWGCNSVWNPQQRSLNDLIDDCAQNFALLLQNKDTVCTWRLVPCRDF